MGRPLAQTYTIHDMTNPRGTVACLIVQGSLFGVTIFELLQLHHVSTPNKKKIKHLLLLNKRKQQQSNTSPKSNQPTKTQPTPKRQSPTKPNPKPPPNNPKDPKTDQNGSNNIKKQQKNGKTKNQSQTTDGTSSASPCFAARPRPSCASALGTRRAPPRRRARSPVKTSKAFEDSPMTRWFLGYLAYINIAKSQRLQSKKLKASWGVRVW